MTQKDRLGRRLSGVFVLACVFACATLGLGVWQVARFFEKTALMAHLEEGVHRPVFPLSLAPPCRLPLDVSSGRLVRLEGVFSPAPPLRFRAVHGGVGGWDLLSVFVTSEGCAILVRRGFISDSQADFPVYEEAGSLVTVEGRVYFPPRGHFSSLDNLPGDNQWYWWEIPAMFASAGGGCASLACGEFVLWDRDLSFFPALLARPPSTHMGYALTWFCLSVGLMLAGVFALKREQ